MAGLQEQLVEPRLVVEQLVGPPLLVVDQVAELPHLVE
jgi:hypothetical protein